MDPGNFRSRPRTLDARSSQVPAIRPHVSRRSRAHSDRPGRRTLPRIPFPRVRHCSSAPAPLWPRCPVERISPSKTAKTKAIRSWLTAATPLLSPTRKTRDPVRAARLQFRRALLHKPPKAPAKYESRVLRAIRQRIPDWNSIPTIQTSSAIPLKAQPHLCEKATPRHSTIPSIPSSSLPPKDTLQNLQQAFALHENARQENPAPPAPVRPIQRFPLLSPPATFQPPCRFLSATNQAFQSSNIPEF